MTPAFLPTAGRRAWSRRWKGRCCSTGCGTACTAISATGRIFPLCSRDLAALPLAGPDGSPLGELPLLGCTDTPPALREEYDQYTLVQFWPLSLWQSLGGRLGLADAGGTTLRILGGEGITLAGCEALEAQIRPLLEQAGYAFTIENRIGEQLANDPDDRRRTGDPGRVLPAAGGHRAGQRLSQHAGLCGPAPAGVCPLPCRGHDARGAAQPCSGSRPRCWPGGRWPSPCR